MMLITTFNRFVLCLICMTQFSDVNANSYYYATQDTYGYDLDDIKAFWYGGVNVYKYGYDYTINTKYMTQYYGYDDIDDTNYPTQYYGYGGKPDSNGYATNPTDYFQPYALSQLSSPPTQDITNSKSKTSKSNTYNLGLVLGFGLGIIVVAIVRIYYQK